MVEYFVNFTIAYSTRWDEKSKCKLCAIFISSTPLKSEYGRLIQKRALGSGHVMIRQATIPRTSSRMLSHRTSTVSANASWNDRRFPHPFPLLTAHPLPITAVGGAASRCGRFIAWSSALNGSGEGCRTIRKLHRTRGIFWISPYLRTVVVFVVIQLQPGEWKTERLKLDAPYHFGVNLTLGRWKMLCWAPDCWGACRLGDTDT